MTSDTCGQLCLGVEKAVKAIIIEKTGTIPKELRSHNLSYILDNIGLTPYLSQPFVNTIVILTPFNPNVRYPSEPPYKTLVDSGSSINWQNHIKNSADLINFIAKDIIPNN